ncbi:MAG TPA: hypothetical protein VGW74_09415 [Propionibacteriaceae bacterium]|nr:hypothetical protein [Propionibacteriaceae bacterium]
MAMDIETVTHLFKTGESAVGNCPGVSRGGGGFVVTGKVLTDATLARVKDLGDDEVAVWVPIDVLDPERLSGLSEFGGSA